MNNTAISVDIIGTVGVPASYGGFETLAENLISEWSDKPIECTVYCSAVAYDNKLETYKNARLVYLPFMANGVSSILYDAVSIVKSSFSKADVLLVLGVSGALMFPIARLAGKRIVVNVDGLEWKRQKWGRFASTALKFFERVASYAAHEIITDNKVIQDYIKSEYGKESSLITYGADHVVLNHDPHEKQGELPAERYAIKVCRIEPENNVGMVLEAFSELPAFTVVVIGNWEASGYGRDLRRKYGSFNNIRLMDPIYDLERLYWLRSNAFIYLHGHSAGGTNPSLVEAMYLALPILAFDCNYNVSSTDGEAFYFTTSTDIIKCITSIKPEDIVNNKNSMKMIADNRYTWASVVAKYESILA